MKDIRITRISTAVVSIPLDRPVTTPIHHITTVDNVLVTVHTDEALEGIAYLWCFGPERAATLASMVADLGAFVVGSDPRETSSLWSRLWRETNFLGRSGIAMFAHSAIDIACWDIKAKALDEPLWRLLGGHRRPIPAYAGGLFLNDSIDMIVAEARGYVAAGFKAMKMRTGLSRLSEDLERVEAVRAEIGPDIALMIDVVQGWTPDQAIRAGRELTRFDIAWMEDPVAFDDHAGLSAVAAAIDMPVCAGESDYSLSGFTRLIQGKCVDIAMPDLQRVGGISEWMRVAALADAFRMRVTPHVFHEISVHLMTAIPNGFWLEHVPWWNRLFLEPVLVEQGSISASGRPGLGLAFAWEGIDRFRVS